MVNTCALPRRRYSGLVPDNALLAAARFHGHLGPWLVLGLRAGAYARRRLGGTPFELTARVTCPERPPHTCFLDGVQLSSGCTMGKGNICHVVGDCCRVEFVRHHSPGRKMARTPGRPAARLALELQPDVWQELHRHTGNVERLAKTLYRRRFDTLFRVLPP